MPSTNDSPSATSKANVALAGIEKFARSGHGRFNRPDASVMRPASQRFKRIVPIASRPSAQGSDDSVERVIVVDLGGGDWQAHRE